jgi:cysteine desulfurase
VREGVALAPILHGGGQERERRSGTNDVAAAVGLAAALRACAAGRDTERARLRHRRDRLADGLVAAVPGLHETVPRHRTLPGHLHVTVDGVEREELLVLLDRAGVCASAGASCASGALEPSHVLAAMGVDPVRAQGALRLTLGHTTTNDDVDRALEVVSAAVASLRANDRVGA